MLEIKRFRVSGTDFLDMVLHCNRDTPEWFVQGVVMSDATVDGVADEDVMVHPDSVCEFSTYSEGTIFDEHSWLKDHEVSVTAAQTEHAHRCAAARAVRIATTHRNYAEVGELFLNKHPSCRKQPTEDLAIFEAAIEERKCTFTKEMYDF